MNNVADWLSIFKNMGVGIKSKKNANNYILDYFAPLIMGSKGTYSLTMIFLFVGTFGMYIHSPY